MAAGGDRIRPQTSSTTDWELCIADDASTDPGSARCFDEFQSQDSRIKVALPKVNGHISAASNTALGLAIRRIHRLLDHDDVLPSHALACSGARAEPRIATPTSSTATRTGSTNRGGVTTRYFKPDWNPELFCGAESDQPPRRLSDGSRAAASADFARVSRAARTTTWRWRIIEQTESDRSGTSRTSCTTGVRSAVRRRSGRVRRCTPTARHGGRSGAP